MTEQGNGFARQEGSSRTIRTTSGRSQSDTPRTRTGPRSVAAQPVTRRIAEGATTQPTVPKERAAGRRATFDRQAFAPPVHMDRPQLAPPDAVQGVPAPPTKQGGQHPFLMCIQGVESRRGHQPEENPS